MLCSNILLHRDGNARQKSCIKTHVTYHQYGFILGSHISEMLIFDRHDNDMEFTSDIAKELVPNRCKSASVLCAS